MANPKFTFIFEYCMYTEKHKFQTKSYVENFRSILFWSENVDSSVKLDILNLFIMHNSKANLTYKKQWTSTVTSTVLFFLEDLYYTDRLKQYFTTVEMSVWNNTSEQSKREIETIHHNNRKDLLKQYSNTWQRPKRPLETIHRNSRKDHLKQYFTTV